MFNRPMKRFYPDFDAINDFTLSLGFHQNQLECTHCAKSDQFVSHGIIYKQRSSSRVQKVGKRILCSKRYGRQGCGRTFQIYIANEIPSLRYGSAHLLVFITALIAKSTIETAYLQATGQSESRNAWRWLNKLMVKLSEYRTFLKSRKEGCFNQTHSNSNQLKHLLPTLARLFASANNGCVVVQMRQQQPFF